MDQYVTSSIIDALGGLSAATLAVLAVLAWYFREKLKVLWSFDGERLKAQLQHELEAAKASMQREHAGLLAQHQRELEAYKVSLIAETERAKATQEVAKSLALRVAERRFSAIANLHDASSELSVDVPTFARTPFDSHISHQGQWLEQMKRHQQLARAYSVACPFISIAVRQQVLDLLSPCARLLDACRTFPVNSEEGTEAHDLAQLTVRAGADLQRNLAAMLADYETMTPPRANIS